MLDTLQLYRLSVATLLQVPPEKLSRDRKLSIDLNLISKSRFQVSLMFRSSRQNYPAVCLEQAIPMVHLIYEQHSNNAITSEIVAAVFGLSLSDPALSCCIASLLKFGLLKSVGYQLFQVSENAENIILLSKGHPDRIAALKNAAFTPYLFSKLRELLGEQLPDNDLIYSSLAGIGFSSHPIEKIANSYTWLTDKTQAAKL